MIQILLFHQTHAFSIKVLQKEMNHILQEISIENTIKTLFVKEITPTGLATVRSAEITNGIANCNFKTTIPSVRSLAASTRSFTTITDPNPDDTSLFPLECPSGIEKFISVNDCVEGGSYEVTASTKIINLWKNNLKLYVTEDIKLSEQIYLSPGSCLYILPGKKVSMPKSQNNGQQNCMDYNRYRSNFDNR